MNYGTRTLWEERAELDKDHLDYLKNRLANSKNSYDKRYFKMKIEYLLESLDTKLTIRMIRDILK